MYNSFFPTWRIGRGARSLDQAPCKFFLWGHLKNKIYSEEKLCIFENWNLIINRQLANFKALFYDRLVYWFAENGVLFEYLM